MKLIAGEIATLPWPEGAAETFVWDDDIPGFGLRQRSEEGPPGGFSSIATVASSAA